jgi:hypothetical protein
MKIILDGKEFAYNPEIEKTIAAKLKNENLVIHSIKAGGVDLINATLEEALSKPVPGRIISIETRPAEDLLWESMKDAREYLPRLKEGILKLRESFLEGNNDSFKRMVEAALEGLEWLGLTFQAFISQKHPAHAERVFTMEYSRLAFALKELEAGLQAGKPERVCDIFEKDIVSFLDKMFPLAEEMLGMKKP